MEDYFASDENVVGSIPTEAPTQSSAQSCSFFIFQFHIFISMIIQVKVSCQIDRIHGTNITTLSFVIIVQMKRISYLSFNISSLNERSQ